MVFSIEKRFKKGTLSNVFFLSIVIFPRLVLDTPMMLRKSSVKQRYSMFFALFYFWLLVGHKELLHGCAVNHQTVTVIITTAETLFSSHLLNGHPY